MLKIYLDNCCYNRPFDDLSKERIESEATAKLFIQSLIKYRSIELYYSFMTQAEIDDSPFEGIKVHILDFIEKNAAVFISDKHAEALKELTGKIMQTGIKMKDATHLACAIFAGCDYFVTVDKRLLKYKPDKIKIVSLLEFAEIWRKSV